jgi:hypothetical protein
MKVTFQPREAPPAPVAIAAVDDGVEVLAARLLAMSDDVLARFSGVSTDGAIVVSGPTDLLPWFDGALYLGASGALWWPTWATPSVHPQLLEKALRRHCTGAPPGPLAVLFRRFDEPPRVVPMALARPLSRNKLGALVR